MDRQTYGWQEKKNKFSENPLEPQAQMEFLTISEST